MKKQIYTAIVFLAIYGITLRAELRSPGSLAERNAPVFASAEAVSPDEIGAFTTTEDSTHILVLKFNGNQNGALKLSLSDMRLPTGAKLFAYGLKNGAVTQIAGPWQTSGPMNGEPFETPALEGSEIVLELQVTGNELPSDLPFTVANLSPTASADAPEVAFDSEVETRTSLFRGMQLTHEVRDGEAVFEGDILLNEEELMPADDDKTERRGGVGITGDRFRWPGGVIPYRIDPALPNQQRVINAMNHWNTVLTGVIKFVPFSGEMSHLYVSRHTSAGQCAANVGMTGYMQYLWMGDSCTLGNAIHELGHAVGLWHEHTREDRDQFVKILWENITASQQFNFTANIESGDDYGAYDFASVMHYPANSFSSNGKPTIQTIPTGVPIGQRAGLSAGDIAAVKAMYGATPPPAPGQTTVPITIRTNPETVPVTVDGTEYTSAVTLNWIPGSTHTISAPSSWTVGGTRNTFVKWNDNGAASHSVVAPATASGFQADFTVAYSLAATPVGAGTVVISPQASDSYYAPNTTIAINAIPDSGSCFAGWQGLLSGTPAAASVQMTKAYTLQALFQAGAVTVPTMSYSGLRTGGTVNIGVHATSGCQWKATTSYSWIRISSDVTGRGSGVITVQVDPNPNTASRSGIVAVGGKIAVINQPGRR